MAPIRYRNSFLYSKHTSAYIYISYLLIQNHFEFISVQGNAIAEIQPVTSERNLPASTAITTPADATMNEINDEPSATTGTAAAGGTTGGGAGGNSVTLETLSRMLDAMPNNNRTAGNAVPRPVFATVGDLLRTAELKEFVSSDDADLAAVYETIPAVERNPESVKQLLRCQAVQSQALSLTRALLEAPPGDVLPSLGLPLPSTPGIMGMQALIEAIKKAANEP